MNFYTITENRDDARLAAFARFVAQNRPTSVLVICRPEHIAPNRQNWDALTAQHAKAITDAREAGAALDFPLAQQHKANADQLAAQITELNANSAKWLTDALALTELPDASGFVVMPDSQWRQPWNVLNFLSAIPAIEKDGIGGTPFRLPLHRRVFIPLSVFDAAVPKAAPTPQQSAPTAPLSPEDDVDLPPAPEINKPTTAPVHLDTTLYTSPQQIHMLSAVTSEAQKKLLATYLGWDRDGKARSIKTTSIRIGTSINATNMMIGRLKAALSKVDVDLAAEHARAFGNGDVEEVA